MKHVVCSYEMGVDENLRIVKDRYVPQGADEENTDSSLPRVCLVTGIHGNELEGQYFCYEVARRLREHPEFLTGIVDIYPALNPLGIGAITRGIPQFDLDMNRIFPGNNAASPFEAIAADIIDDIKGSTLVLDVHASNIYLRELPQIRINEITAERLVPWAMEANVDYIWVHANATVLKGTFAYSLNALDTPTLVVEMGVGMRITRAYGDQLADGVMRLLGKAGVWSGPVPEVRTPLVSTDGEVDFMNAEVAGLFIPEAQHDVHVEKGQLIGNVVDTSGGQVLQEVRSPASGLLFTLREYPVVYPGSLIARVLGKSSSPVPGVEKKPEPLETPSSPDLTSFMGHFHIHRHSKEA